MGMAIGADFDHEAVWGFKGQARNSVRGPSQEREGFERFKPVILVEQVV